MRAVTVRRHGGPEVLELDDVPEPVPGEGALLVEVGAAGVTLPIVRQVRGGTALPFRPGGEVAGRVLAVGPAVTGWQIGDRCAGLAFEGALAARAAGPAAFQMPVPDTVADTAAVALVRSGQAALGTLRVAAVVPGESVVVTAAAGGSVTVCLPLLAPFGRLAAFNGVGGPVDTNELRMHGRSVIGFAMPHLAIRRRAADEQQQRELWQWHVEGRLRPVIHGPFPLEQVAEAFAAIESRTNRGKVVVTP